MSAPCLIAVVETDEAAGLERLAEGDRLGVAQPPVADGVVEPDVLDRAVLREQFLELRLLHLGILAAAGLPPFPSAAPGQVQSPSEK